MEWAGARVFDARRLEFTSSASDDDDDDDDIVVSESCGRIILEGIHRATIRRQAGREISPYISVTRTGWGCRTPGEPKVDDDEKGMKRRRRRYETTTTPNGVERRRS